VCLSAPANNLLLSHIYQTGGGGVHSAEAKEVWRGLDND
jgi:hypothetical protein